MMEIFTGFAHMLKGTCRKINEKRDLPYIKLTYTQHCAPNTFPNKQCILRKVLTSLSPSRPRSWFQWKDQVSSQQVPSQNPLTLPVNRPANPIRN